MQRSGYSNNMERGKATPVRYGRGFWGSFLGTTLWLLPLLLLFGIGGYTLARFVLAPHLLQPSKVQVARPQAIRVLSPEEAASIARDEPSPVWTQGVRDSDIPKMDNDQTGQSPKHRYWHSQHKKDNSTPPEEKPAPNTAAPVDAPAADNGPTTAPPAHQPPADQSPAPKSPDTPAGTGGDGAAAGTPPTQ